MPEVPISVESTRRRATPFRSPAPILIYVLYTGNLYGSERMALATLAGLGEYKKRVVFAANPEGPGSVLDAAHEAGYETVVFQGRKELIRVLWPYFLRHRRVDIIGTGVGGAFVCSVLAKLLWVRLRQVVVVHGGIEAKRSYGTKHRLGKIGVRAVAVSAFVRDELIHWGVRPEAVSVVENFLSHERRQECRPRAKYDSLQRGARPLDQVHVKVSVISRAHPIKRLDLLVEAVERYGLVEFEFTIFGTGQDLEALRTRAQPFSNIHFRGFLEDAKGQLRDADFLLHLCPVEPFGLVVLEAAASEVVVIVPDAGGAGSLIDDGLTGLRFRANDIDDLNRVLQAARMMSGIELQRLADNGKASMERRFAPEEGVRGYRNALSNPVPIRW